ncbi:MAG: nuclear transport factor 2 family protein [Pseudomonadota bacterium]
MEASAALQDLLDRQAISACVLQYATAVDAHDWPLYADCFTDPLHRDFTAFAPDVVGEIDAKQWASEVSSTLTGFDATQHNSTNHRHDIRGDEATCWSYMTAEHVYIEDGVSQVVTLGGEYTNVLVRDGARWRIRSCTLNVRWSRGNMGLFEKAVKRAAEEGRAWMVNAQ